MMWMCKPWPWWLRWAFNTERRSMTTPWGAIYLRDGAFTMSGIVITKGTLAISALIAHESVHVWQMKDHRGWVFGPWLWTLRYLLSAKFRLSQEIEAEAREAYERAKLLGAPVEAHHVSHGLRPGGVYKLPKGTDRAAVTAEILARAKELEALASVSATVREMGVTVAEFVDGARSFNAALDRRQELLVEHGLQLPESLDVVPVAAFGVGVGHGGPAVVWDRTVVPMKAIGQATGFSTEVTTKESDDAER